MGPCPSSCLLILWKARWFLSLPNPASSFIGEWPYGTMLVSNPPSHSHLIGLCCFMQKPKWSTLSRAQWRGYLNKQGGKRKSWNRRYFVLVGGEDACMYYFKTMPEGHDCKPEGAISLVSSGVTYGEGKSSRDLCVSVMTPERQYFFQAAMEVEAREWLAHIKAVIDQRSVKRSVNFKFV